MPLPIKVAILDSSVNRGLYSPVEHWSRHLDVPWEAFDARAGRFPDLGEDFSHIILTGSEASILDREPWVEVEADFVRRAVGRNIALLGSCWGHQLLAYALAGPDFVRRCPSPEVGWIGIDRPAPSGLLGEEGTAYSFSLHFDEVVNRNGRFRVLASTLACPVQALALEGHRVWGLQIHPEIDVSAARKLLEGSLSLNPASERLYRTALESEPRDSGLIGRIVAFFLAS